MSQRSPRPLPMILSDFSQTLTDTAGASSPPVDVSLELSMVAQVLGSGIESRMFRALEVLVLSAHAAGLLAEGKSMPEHPSYTEAVQVLRMGGIALPDDLP